VYKRSIFREGKIVFFLGRYSLHYGRKAVDLLKD